MASSVTNRTLVALETKGSHATITFATEDALNILSASVLHTLGATVARVRKDPAIRTTTIRADGRVFIAGADIHEMASFSVDQAREYAALGQGVMADIASLPSITVAAIQGAALGGGLELALACDFRIAVKTAKLGMPEVSLGLIPGWGGIGRLTRLIGIGRAKRLFLSATPASADTAMGWGLIDEVVNSSEDLLVRVPAFCESFYRAGPCAVVLAKRASRDFDDAGAFAECFENRESREGMKAFIEKRPARWME